MISVGIDAGAKNTKVAILNDDGILFCSINPQHNESVTSVAQRGLAEAMRLAGVHVRERKYIVTTGIGREYVNFADEPITEPICCARGVNSLLPSTRTVIDIGAEKCLVVSCQEGRALRIARHDRCAGCAGRYLDMVSNLFGIRVEEMGSLSLQAQEHLDIVSTCAVFAESEIISLIHQKYGLADILGGVFRGLAQRIYPLLVSVGLEGDVSMIGGVSKNVGVVKAMQEQIGRNILVPQEPLVVGALGAVIVAAERRRVSTEVLGKISLRKPLAQ